MVRGHRSQAVQFNPDGGRMETARLLLQADEDLRPLGGGEAEKPGCLGLSTARSRPLMTRCRVCRVGVGCLHRSRPLDCRLGKRKNPCKIRGGVGYVGLYNTRTRARVDT